MKRSLFLLLSSLLISLSPAALVSCQTGPNAQTGTAAGALGGGTLGAIIGNQSHNPVGGAAIGAVAGGLTGNAIGGAYDR
jgi:uncharacterized membrane protein